MAVECATEQTVGKHVEFSNSLRERSLASCASETPSSSVATTVSPCLKRSISPYSMTSELRMNDDSDENAGWFTSSLSRTMRYPRTVPFSSHRVHETGRTGGHEVSRGTVVDTASDLPCLMFGCVQRHPVFEDDPIIAVPSASVSLTPANRTLCRCVRFDLQLGDVTRPVEALVFYFLSRS